MILRTDLSHEFVEPKNGTDYTFEEVYKLINCSMIEIVRIEGTTSLLLVDEEGLMKEDIRKNMMASLMAVGQTIVGDALLCLEDEVL